MNWSWLYKIYFWNKFYFLLPKYTGLVDRSQQVRTWSLLVHAIAQVSRTLGFYLEKRKHQEKKLFSIVLLIRKHSRGQTSFGNFIACRGVISLFTIVESTRSRKSFQPSKHKSAMLIRSWCTLQLLRCLRRSWALYSLANADDGRSPPAYLVLAVHTCGYMWLTKTNTSFVKDSISSSGVAILLDCRTHFSDFEKRFPWIDITAPDTARVCSLSLSLVPFQISRWRPAERWR